MSHVKSETATRLKEAGFPQPQTASGQFWYDGNGDLYVIQQDQGSDGVCGAFMDMDDTFVEPQNEFDVFAPTVEDITAFLPSSFTLEMWEGRHSCHIETPYLEIRTQADNFAEAAALAWLSLNTPQ